MSGDRAEDYYHKHEDGERLDDALVLFSMLLYDALLGIFAAIAFTFGDTRSAILLAITGLMTFVGLTCQMVFGLKPLVRFFYGLCGLVVYFFLVVRGGQDSSGLFAAVGLVFGFVIVLGWRLALCFLASMAAVLIVIFYRDIYLEGSQPFPLMMELKFFVAHVGLSVLALGYGYVLDSRIEHLRAYSRKMASLAYRDAMTNLPNRRSTEDLLKQRWEEYKRSGNLFAVFLCNIDDFKEVNTQFGSGFGDGVILRIANVLIHGLRSQDIISRWGGDEFLIILPGQNSQTAMKVAERIRARVANIELVMRGKPVPVSVSLGVASVEHALSPEDLVGMAEAGLFQAKHSGKNRVMMG